MQKNDIRVLALDLDGTLTNHERKITPRTMRALQAAMQKGVLVVLASGRPTAGIEPLAKELDLYHKGGYILSYNGGTVLDCKTGQILYQNEVPAQLIPSICAFAKEQEVALISYNDVGVISESPDDPWARKECDISKIPMIAVNSLAQYITFPISKMLVTLDPARMEAVKTAMQQRFAGQLEIYPSCPFFIEVMPRGIAKDAGLAVLLERLGLTPENLMACGDGANDHAMISYAGVGVAMQNADPVVKAVATYVTVADNDNDGVAEAIEAFILAE